MHDIFSTFNKSRKFRATNVMLFLTDRERPRKKSKLFVGKSNWQWKKFGFALFCSCLATGLQRYQQNLNFLVDPQYVWFLLISGTHTYRIFQIVWRRKCKKAARKRVHVRTVSAEFFSLNLRKLWWSFCFPGTCESDLPQGRNIGVAPHESPYFMAHSTLNQTGELCARATFVTQIFPCSETGSQFVLRWAQGRRRWKWRWLRAIKETVENSGWSTGIVRNMAFSSSPLWRSCVWRSHTPRQTSGHWSLLHFEMWTGTLLSWNLDAPSRSSFRGWCALDVGSVLVWWGEQSLKTYFRWRK